jgi:hypothetical protein
MISGLTPEQKCLTDKMKQIALLLNYLIKKVSIDVRNLSTDMIKAALYDLCKSNPEAVLSCYRPGSDDDIFVMELVHYNILTLKEGKFYDGTRFVGGDILAVKEYMSKSDHSSDKSRWLSQLDTYKGKKVNSQQEVFEKELNKIKILIYDKKYDEAEKELDNLESIFPENDRIDGLRADLKQVMFIDGKEDGNEMSPAQKDKYDELQLLEVDDLKKIASNAKRKKVDYQDLDKEQMIRYLVSFIKN